MPTPLQDGRSWAWSSATAQRTGGVQPQPTLAGATRIVTQRNPSIESLTDDYATADTAKWTFPASTGVSGGQLVLTPNSSYTAHVVSVSQYDLRGSSVIVELVQSPNVGTGTISAWFAVWTDSISGNALRWEWLNGNLVAEYLLGGVQTVLATLTYDAVAHRWLRIRESAGTVYWDTSPDRQTWTQQGSTTPGYGVGGVSVSFLAGYFGTEPTPGTAIFDNLNVAPPASSDGTVDGEDAWAGGYAPDGGSPSLTTVGVDATSGGWADAGAVSAGASLTGTDAEATASAPAGSVQAGATVTGPDAQPTGWADAGTVSAGATVAGQDAQATAAAAAGTLTASPTITGQDAWATGDVPAGTFTTTAQVTGQTAAATGWADAGTPLTGTVVSGADAWAAGGAPVGGLAADQTISGADGWAGANTPAGWLAADQAIGGAPAAGWADTPAGLIVLIIDATVPGDTATGGADTPAGDVTIVDATARDITVTVGPPRTRTVEGAAAVRELAGDVASRAAAGQARSRGLAGAVSTRTLAGTVQEA